MKNWTLHWLDATGDCHDWKAGIKAEIAAAHDAMGRFVTLSPQDILVERSNEGVIAQIALQARATRAARLSLVFDPFNDNYHRALQSGALQRQIIRAAHLSMRLAGPGYGFTLGGAMVSEGLAGQFVRLVTGAPPEPWDKAVPDLSPYWPGQRELMNPRYDHGLWFDGRGDKPLWLGQSMGFKLAENWLTSGAEITPERMIDIPAPKVLAANIATEKAS
jgi:hypothetical protein